MLLSHQTNQAARGDRRMSETWPRYYTLYKFPAFIVRNPPPLKGEIDGIVANNLLGTPETSRSGRRTRNARNALTSNPSFIMVDKAALRGNFIVRRLVDRIVFVLLRRFFTR